MNLRARKILEIIAQLGFYCRYKGCKIPVSDSDNKHPSKRETKMTESQKSRIVQAIKECDSFIAKEEPRNSSVRPDEITKLLAFYYSHREMLQKKLACK